MAATLTDALADPIFAGFAVARAWDLSDEEAAAAFGYLPPVATYWEKGWPVGVDLENIARGMYLLGIHRAVQPWCGGNIRSFVRRVMKLPKHPNQSIVDLVTSRDIATLEYVYRYFRASLM